jgi:hypothetical protein
VHQDAIARKLGHKVDSMVPAELVRLRKVYRAIKDGYTSVESEFSPAAGEQSPDATQSAAAKAAAAAAAKANPATSPPATSPSKPQPADAPVDGATKEKF